jgi:hypothetical protein
MEITHGWERNLLAGSSPYHAVGVAYPPLAMMLFILPGLGSTSLDAYRLTFPAFVLLADLAGLMLAVRAERAGWRCAAPAYLLAVPAVGPVLLLWRYDLLPAVLHLAACIALVRGHRRTSWLCLGVGIALKPYLAVLLPLWLTWDLVNRGFDLRSLLVDSVLVAAPSLLSAALIFPLSGSSFMSAYVFQVSRTLTADSTPAVLVAEFVHHATRQVAVVDMQCLCWVHPTRAGTLIRTISSGSLVFALGVVVVRYVLRPTSTTLVAGSSVAILLLLVTSVVYSPQYMTWPLPAMALLAGTRRGRIALVLVGVSAVTEFFAYPGNWTSILTYAPLGRFLLLLRTATMLLAIPVLLWPESQGFPKNVWSSRIRGTLKNRPGQEGATGAAGPQSPAGRRNT